MMTPSLFALLLFGGTGLVCGWQALQLILWVVWGRQPQSPEFAALLGASAMLVAGVVALYRLRFAAGLALLGATAVWPMYGLATADAIRQSQPTQQLSVLYVRWQPGPEPLSLEYSSPALFQRPVLRLSEEELAILEEAGVSGRLILDEGRHTGSGPPARVIIVATRPVASQVELRQPDRTTVVYLQELEADEWAKLPPGAPTVDRTIRLEPANQTPFQTWDQIEMMHGGRFGGTAFVWPTPDLSGR
jgi:hypothetical protein